MRPATGIILSLVGLGISLWAFGLIAVSDNVLKMGIGTVILAITSFSLILLQPDKD